MAVLAAAPPEPRARLWLYCGEQDRYGLAPAAARFHRAAGDAGFRSTLVLEPGDHQWEYWRRSTLAQLEQIAAGFAPSAPPG
jgi:S-formylglutathione hydrolase FrmB